MLKMSIILTVAVLLNMICMNLNKPTFRLGILFFFCITTPVWAQREVLYTKISQIVQPFQGKVGVAVMGLHSKDTLTFNGNRHFPMQSVYKFPLAMAVLNQVDKGKLSLDQKIRVTKKDLLPDTWSPLREKHPNGNIDVPLRELLSYTVSQSDNNGCDILFRLLGGTKKVDTYVHSLGVKPIAIVATEEEMHRAWEVQFTNWSEPMAMVQLLQLFYQGKVLSQSSRDFLWKIMTETTTGPNRLKGQLPKEVIVGHKTGSSGTNAKGIADATNDVGIVVLPNGKAFAITVFVADSPAPEATRDQVIADISKVVYDYYSE